MDTNSPKNLSHRSVMLAQVDGILAPKPKTVGTSPALSVGAWAANERPRKSVTAQKTQVLPIREPVALPRYQAPERPKQIVRKHLTWRGLVLRASGMVVLLAILTGGFLFWKGYTQVHKVFRGTSTVAALSTKPVDPDLLKGEGDGRINILLLGIGGAGHDGPDLTDTMVVLSVDPVNNTAAFLSIPRDLWVKMPVNYFGANQKINAAYESGKYSYLGKLDQSSANAAAVEAGFASTDQVVSQVLGITINYHVLVNFQAFRQAIDTVGGVDINVSSQLYDPTMAWENNWNPVLAPAGEQTMNGTKALLYARSRETSSDFARTERQRQIMLALKDKVLTAGTLSDPAKITQLLSAFGNNVFSDMSVQGAERFVGIMKNIDDSKIASIGLAQAPNNFVTTDHVGNISIVRPTAGLDNYTDIQNYVHTQLADGYITKEHASVTVLGRTSAGAAAVAAELKTYGYNVTYSGTTTAASLTTEVVDLSKGQDKYTNNYLQNRYSVKASTVLPSGAIIAPSSAKFVIIEPK